MLPGPGVPGCSLISLHFLWANLYRQAVYGKVMFIQMGGWYLHDHETVARSLGQQIERHRAVESDDDNDGEMAPAAAA